MGKAREKKVRKRQWRKRILATALVCLLVIGLIPSDALKVSASDDSIYPSETEAETTTEVATEVTTETMTEDATVVETTTETVETTETVSETDVMETTEAAEIAAIEEEQEYTTEILQLLEESEEISNEKATGSDDNERQAALREKIDAYWDANDVFCEAFDACNGYWDDEAGEWIGGSIWKFMEACDNDASDSELTELHEKAEADYQKVKSLLPTLTSACEAVKAAFDDDTLTEADLSGVYDPNGWDEETEEEKTITFLEAKEAVESDCEEIKGNFESLTDEWIPDSETIELEDGEPQCGFAGHFITEKAYETRNWWENTEDLEVVYWVHADTLQGVIDELLSLDGKVFYQGGRAYTIKNTGYIRVTTSYSPYDKESEKNATAPQYVTTPSGEDGISGILICSAYDYYRAPLPNDEGETQYYEIHNFVNENTDNTDNTDDVIQMVPYEWVEDPEDPGNWISKYRVVEGTYEDGFKLTNDEHLYADGEYGESDDGKRDGYIDAEGELHQQYLETVGKSDEGDGHGGDYIKTDWTELHVDATTEVKVIGDFVEPEKDENGNYKANLYLGLYKDSKLTSFVANNLDYDDYTEITSADIGTVAKKIGNDDEYTEGGHNIYLTVQELVTTTKTNVEEDDFLKSDSVFFGIEDETGGKALRDAMNIEDIVAGHEDVKKDIINGKTLEISYNMKSVPEDNDELSDDIGKIKKSADSAKKIQFIDIGIEHSIGNYKGHVSETNGNIYIAIDLPENFVKSGEKLVVYRCHNGSVTPINVEFKDGKLSFSSDMFSTYGIAVEDNSNAAATTTASTEQVSTETTKTETTTTEQKSTESTTTESTTTEVTKTETITAEGTTAGMATTASQTIGAKDETANSPVTGDTSLWNLAWMLLVFSFAMLAGLSILWIYTKKNRNE